LIGAIAQIAKRGAHGGVVVRLVWGFFAEAQRGEDAEVIASGLRSDEGFAVGWVGRGGEIITHAKPIDTAVCRCFAHWSSADRPSGRRRSTVASSASSPVWSGPAGFSASSSSAAMFTQSRMALQPRHQIRHLFVGQSGTVHPMGPCRTPPNLFSPKQVRASFATHPLIPTPFFPSILPSAFLPDG
jgi:hypothetical protein